MLKVEKVKFVRDLTASILAEVERKISAEHVPAAWDGHELRHLLADKFAASAGTLTGQRLKEFRNDCLVHNL